jgi:hypothetical protein
MQSILGALHLKTVTAAIVSIAFHTVPYYAVNITCTTSHENKLLLAISKLFGTRESHVVLLNCPPEVVQK